MTFDGVIVPANDDMLSMPYTTISVDIPRSSFKYNLYSTDSTYFVTPPTIITSSLVGFPFNLSFLASKNVMNESVLPPSQRAFVVNCFPLDFPTVSHCVGDNVPPPAWLEGVLFCKCRNTTVAKNLLLWDMIYVFGQLFHTYIFLRAAPLACIMNIVDFQSSH